MRSTRFSLSPFTAIAIRITLTSLCCSGYRSRVGSYSAQFGPENGGITSYPALRWVLRIYRKATSPSSLLVSRWSFGGCLVYWAGQSEIQRSQPKHRAGRIYGEERENLKPINRTARKIKKSDIGLQLLAAIATVAPWVIYCLIYYRKEFLWEHRRVLEHLNTDIESWGASWDRPLFDYMPLFYPVFYAALIAAMLCLIVVMFKRWRLAELFVLAWGIGVIVPHTLAQTKTPSATMIAVPPLLICLAAVISRAWQRRDWVYTSIWVAGMLAITIISGGRTLVNGRDQFDGLKVIAPFIQTNFWIVEQLIGIGVLLAIFAGVYRLVRHRNVQRWIWLGLRTVALIIALFYAGRYVYAAYRVTERNSRVPLYEASGQRLQREMPENACFFLDDERVGAHFDLMYYADRSTYQIYNEHMTEPRDFKSQAKIARKAGAIPYLFSVKEMVYDYPLFIEGEVDSGNGKTQRYRVFEITETQ